MRSCWVLILIGSAFIHPGRAALANPYLESLIGIRKMTVAVLIEPKLLGAGLDSTEVLVEAQLALRKVGVQVVDIESTGASSLPSLNLTADGLVIQDGAIFAMAVEASVSQWATLDRDPRKRSLLTTTWQQGDVTVAGRNKIASAVGERFKRLVDMFMNDYLAANPTMAGTH